jgi:hypothetical protein
MAEPQLEEPARITVGRLAILSPAGSLSQFVGGGGPVAGPVPAPKLTNPGPRPAPPEVCFERAGAERA